MNEWTIVKYKNMAQPRQPVVDNQPISSIFNDVKMWNI
jgi:hypothetical protein